MNILLKKGLKYILVFALSFALFWGLVWLRGEGSNIAVLVGCPLTFLLTFFCLKLLKGLNEYLVLLFIWLGISILEVPARIMNFSDTLFTLPTHLYWCAGILLGYGVWKTNRWWKIPVLVLTLLVILSAPKFFKHWQHYFNFGSITGSTELVIDQPVVFQTPEGEDILLSDFKGKYLVLDFWHSTCGVCFSRFPNVQEVYDQVKDRSDVELYSVFCRKLNNDETPAMGTQMLQEREYSFPDISIDIKDPVIKELGVSVYPTVFIFDPDGKLIFRGNIMFARKFLQKQGLIR